MNCALLKCIVLYIHFKTAAVQMQLFVVFNLIIKMNCSYISNFVLNYQIGLHRTTISQLLFLFINFQYNILSHQYVKKTKIIILVNIYSWGTFQKQGRLNSSTSIDQHIFHIFFNRKVALNRHELFHHSSSSQLLGKNLLLEFVCLFYLSRSHYE